MGIVAYNLERRDRGTGRGGCVAGYIRDRETYINETQKGNVQTTATLALRINRANAVRIRDKCKSHGRWENDKIWRNNVTNMTHNTNTSFYQNVFNQWHTPATSNPKPLWANLRNSRSRDTAPTPLIIRDGVQ